MPDKYASVCLARSQKFSAARITSKLPCEMRSNPHEPRSRVGVESQSSIIVACFDFRLDFWLLAGVDFCSCNTIDEAWTTYTIQWAHAYTHTAAAVATKKDNTEYSWTRVCQTGSFM